MRWLREPDVSLDLRKLDHLVVVAEEGSFTRAATRLHLSQQALSTSIRALEREVGVALLDRDASGVRTLPAGQTLVDDARLLHGVARSALQRARRIGRGEPETLRVGHTPAVTGEEISALLDVIPSGHPELRTELHQRYPAQLVDELLRGDVDLGLCRGMTPPPGLTRTTLRHDRLALAVSAEHPLAARTRVELTELTDERFMVWGEPGRSGYTDLLIDHCRNAGFEPTFTRNPVQGAPPVTAVVGTPHVAFVTAAPGPTAGGQAFVLRLDPPIHAPLHALWCPHTTHPARDELLANGG